MHLTEESYATLTSLQLIDESRQLHLRWAVKRQQRDIDENSWTEAAIPSQVVDNHTIKYMVQELATTYKEELLDAIKRIGYYLLYSGSEKRCWLTEEEKPFDLLEEDEPPDPAH